MSHRRKAKGQEEEERIEERMEKLEERIENIFSLDGSKTDIANIQFLVGMLKRFDETNQYLEKNIELLEQNRQMFVSFIKENNLDAVIEKWFKEKSKPTEAPAEVPPVTPPVENPPEVIPPEVQDEENKMSEDNHHNG